MFTSNPSWVKVQDKKQLWKKSSLHTEICKFLLHHFDLTETFQGETLQKKQLLNNKNLGACKFQCENQTASLFFFFFLC